MITKKLLNKFMATVALAVLPAVATIAQDAAAATAAPAAAPATDGYTVLRYVLAGIAILLLILIFMLGSGIKTASEMYIDKRKNVLNKALGITGTLLLLSVFSYAQDAAVKAAVAPKAAIPTDIWLFVSVIALEFIVIVGLLWILYTTLEIKDKKREFYAKQGKPMVSWFDRFNNAVPVEEEETLDLAHNYDGIRELDNKIPGWWSWTFYATILFAVIYLYRMFVSGTLPDQYKELAKDKEIAAAAQAEYLKSSANNVDEKTVKMMDAAGIAAGKVNFDKNCVACHGDKGQGTVGPNLTDDYWLHKGSINDVFYSIKYGWAAKGMRSWKDDFSPVQIAELASYVKSLHGTNPPGAKPKEGELYKDGEAAPAAAADSTKPAADTTKK